MSSLGRDTWPGGRIRSVTGPHATRIALLLLAFLLVVTGAFGSPGPAYAAEDPTTVEVHLTAADPALPARSDTVTLRGTARNTTDEPIEAAQVVLWRRRAPITDLGDLHSITSAPPQTVTGQQMWIEGGYAPLQPDQPIWAPGESRTFEVSVPIAAFGFSWTPGTFLLGAQVVGRPGGRTVATLGQARMLLPLGADGPAASQGTNRIVSVVVLSSRPSQIGPGVFADDHLAHEIGPEGRLTALLRTAERESVAWLVDPSLLDELTAMAAGYSVRTPAGNEPGTGTDEAQAWLSAYARLDRTRGFQLPYAIPDLAMLHRTGLGEVVQGTRTAASRTDGIAGLPLIAYSARGALDTEALRRAEALAPAAILAATPEAARGLLAPVAGAPVIGFSPATTAGGPGPGASHSLIQTRQRLLAESFLTAETEPGSTTVRVITSTEAAQADEVAQAPWVQPLALGDLLTEEPVPWEPQLAYGEEQRAAELPDPQVEVLRDIVGGNDAFIGMLVDEDEATARAAATMARSASSWWRGNRSGFDAFSTPLLTSTRRLWDGQAVELTAQRSVIMSGQSGSFPMTVTNNLDQTIRVSLNFESFQPQRLSIPVMPDIVIPPRQGATVNVQPHAVGNGPVRIWAQVTTPGGRPVSKRVWLTVEATNFGRVGWIIVVASGIVLIATTALRIRQVRRERQAARRAAPDVHGTPPVVRIDPAPSAGDKIDTQTDETTEKGTQVGSDGGERP
ncbi:MAG TPA: hypothetical protein GXZ30_01475 [Propionibacterium sp.]|nr:hypothetical protein [Propionibacterium sp.]